MKTAIGEHVNDDVVIEFYRVSALQSDEIG